MQDKNNSKTPEANESPSSYSLTTLLLTSQTSSKSIDSNMSPLSSSVIEITPNDSNKGRNPLSCSEIEEVEDSNEEDIDSGDENPFLNKKPLSSSIIGITDGDINFQDKNPLSLSSSDLSGSNLGPNDENSPSHSDEEVDDSDIDHEGKNPLLSRFLSLGS